MSQTLLKIAKLIPMLGTSNDHERLVALAMIEKALGAENLSFTDAGAQLREFVTSVLNEPEPEPEPVRPPQPTGWTSASGTSARPSSYAGGGGSGGFRQASPPPRPPPPRTWTEHQVPLTSPARIMAYEARLSKYLNLTPSQARPLIRNKNERQFLEDMYFRISSGTDPLTLTINQQQWLCDILNRAPANF